MTVPANPPPLPRRPKRSRVVRWVLAGVVLVVLVIVLFRPVEDWRGRRAWQKCRQELEARGEVLEWAAYIPRPVPEEQNIFNVSKMAEWFVGRQTNELVRLLDPENFIASVRPEDSVTIKVAELNLVNTETNLSLEKVDALLRYLQNGGVNYTRLHRALNQSARSKAMGSGSNIIPLIILQDVPFTDAITNLARQAGLRYGFDPSLKLQSKDRGAGPPAVSISWEDVTAQEAIEDLLANYNLQWVEDPKIGVARITVRDATTPQMRGFPSLQEHLGQLIQKGLGTSAKAAQGFTLISNFDQINPARFVMVLHAEGSPTAQQISEYLPTNGLVPSLPGASRLRVEPSGTNSFNVVLERSQIFTASEFLRWSDQFQPHFDMIRQALKRPYARMDGDYDDPLAIPIPNYKVFRLASQTLAQRAQCYLRLGQPENALRELILIHQMLVLLEGKPVTMVAAMIYVAITGMYADVVADGLRWHVWREPQLAALQKMLGTVRLLPLLAAALRSERAGGCRILEKFLTLAKNQASSSLETNRVLHQSGPASLLLRGRKLGMPLGWFDQNLVTLARWEQRAIDSMDTTNNIVWVDRVNAWEQEMQRVRKGFRPYAFFAELYVPNYAKAFQSLARNQALADQAFIECALERYRLKNGLYPSALEELAPQFVTKLPRDIVGGGSMRYKIRDGEFLLYSIGWNNKDDGGARSTGTHDLDWVWPN